MNSPIRPGRPERPGPAASWALAGYVLRGPDRGEVDPSEGAPATGSDVRQPHQLGHLER